MENNNQEKIITVEAAKTISEQLRKTDNTIVLVGGCFDILHIGHITFLQAAKAMGDTLFVLLESDATVKHLKGAQRPINTQQDRAVILSALAIVDFVVLLPGQMTNSLYDQLISAIKPAIIATTAGDSGRHHKERQAAAVAAELVDVVGRMEQQSTTKISALLAKEIL